MSSALPFTEVAGEKLTSEQTAYLEGLFAGLKNRGLTFTDVAPNPAATTVKPDFSSLLAEERIKPNRRVIDAGGEAEKRAIPLSSVLAGIASVRCG